MIGKKINFLRKENSISAKTLADKLNTSVSLIYEWEHNRCNPAIEELIKLADFFDVTIDYLVDREDDLGNVKKQDVLSEEDKDILNQLHALGPFEMESIKIQIKALADAKKSDALTHGKK